MDQNENLIGAIDAGTRTIKFCVFKSQHSKEIAKHEVKIASKSPREGWMEQNPKEIIRAVLECMYEVSSKLNGQGGKLVTIGITNQRETTILWDKITGEPLYNAIVWNDIRTSSTVDIILARVPDNNKDYFKPICGLPVSPYFSAFKIKWLMHYVLDIRKAIREKRCLFGTVDSWILWNLTGGPEGGLHITDVSNASRTFLMNLETLYWDPVLLHTFNIPEEILPEIRSSSEIYGRIGKGFPFENVTISGILGNQQSALIGHHCLKMGDTKNTYRSGCFILYNTGNTKVFSSHGLVTTIAYKFGDSEPVYALEGSVAVAGAALNWLRDNMGLVKHVQRDTEALANEVHNTGDVYFVPAFKGLYAPYWRKDARGIICGLTAFTTKQHIIRAALESVCFQTRDILEAMHKDSGTPLTRLHVDGKLTPNNLLMQLQADISGVPVLRTQYEDITPLGVAMAAGKAKGIDVWDLNSDDMDVISKDTFLPTTTDDDRDAKYKKWKMAVERSLGWALPKMDVTMTDERYRLLASVPGSLFLISSFGLLLLSNYV